jgi:hypothetical protein
MDSAYDMLMGEIMTFSFSPVPSSTSLKISKAKELPDSIRDTWSCVSSIGTGSVGKSSSVLLHDTVNRDKIMKMAADDLVILVFIMIYFTD